MRPTKAYHSTKLTKQCPYVYNPWVCAVDISDTDLDAAWHAASPLQSWDGIDGAPTPFSVSSLSSLPLGDVDAAEAAAAANEGLPTYRTTSLGGGSKRTTGYGGVSGGPAGSTSASLPSRGRQQQQQKQQQQAGAIAASGLFLKPLEEMDPQQAALEDLLMHRAVDEAMALHHERMETGHSRFATALRFGELLEAVELEDYHRGTVPLLPGTGQKLPTWVRAAEVLHEEMPELNALAAAVEEAASEAELQRVKDAILEEVDSAVRLLADVDPQAGISRQELPASESALEDLFGDEEDGTLLPGVGPLLSQGYPQQTDSAEDERLREIGLAAVKGEYLAGKQTLTNRDIETMAWQRLAPEMDEAAAEGRAARGLAPASSSGETEDEDEEAEEAHEKGVARRQLTTNSTFDDKDGDDEDGEDEDGDVGLGGVGAGVLDVEEETESETDDDVVGERQSGGQAQGIGGIQELGSDDDDGHFLKMKRSENVKGEDAEMAGWSDEELL
jgi:hypothetical protein